jgi:hypothetical protein
MGIALRLQALAERSDKTCEGARRGAAEEPNDRHRRLLRTHRERPSHGRAAEQRDELSPSHVEHGGFLPQSVCLTLSLPQDGWQVLGADLNCS